MMLLDTAKRLKNLYVMSFSLVGVLLLRIFTLSYVKMRAQNDCNLNVNHLVVGGDVTNVLFIFTTEHGSLKTLTFVKYQVTRQASSVVSVAQK